MRKVIVFARSEIITINDTIIRPMTAPINFLDNAEKIQFVSTSAEDSLSGNGAKILVIIGLDNNHKPLGETLSLNGLTPVLTEHEYLRINRIEVFTSGTLEKNVGLITAFAPIGGFYLMSIPIGYSRSLSSVFTIPEKTKGVLTQVFINTPKGRDVNAKLVYRSFGTQRIVGIVDSFESQGEIGVNGGRPVAEKTDIFALANSSTPNTTVSCFYTLELTKDL
jgi:hypothetical protein